MFKRVLIPKEVERETVEKGKGYLDAVKIQESIKEGLIEVKEVKDQKEVSNLMRTYGLGKGEAEALQLYLQEKADFLFCDERKARNVAKILNIDLVGTPEVILQLHRSGVIQKEKAKESIVKLDEIGWFKGSVIFKALSEID